MIPAATYDQIELLLNETSFQSNVGYIEGIPIINNLVGFIFFDQNFSSKASGDFLKNLHFLSENSGKFIHFFLPGVSKYGSNPDDISVEIPGLNPPHYHNTRAFLSFRDKFEHHIPNWKFDSGISVVLIDLSKVKGVRILDFDSAIFFDVNQLITHQIVDNTSQLLSKIIRLVRDSELVTAKEIRGAFELQFGKNWMKGLILGLFPKKLKRLTKVSTVLAGGRAHNE